MAMSMKQQQNSVDSDYFTSYEDLDVHKLMLKDEPRTRAYQTFIANNEELFKDKIVVDVGAGTGILSLFAAKAGAKKVYAIEASGVSELCRQIVAHNGYSNRIVVLEGRAEDISLPDGIQADVLISEWMGFYLLHESMLESVIAARERFLKLDGIMLPSAATLYLCPVSMKDFYRDNFRCWSKTYGFDFSPMVPHLKHRVLSSPQIELLTHEQCLADPEEVLNLDLKFVEAEDIKKILSHVKFVLTKNGLLHGLACWFDVEFEGEVSNILSTGPRSESTHWKQTVIILPDPLLVNKNDTLQCNFLLEQSPDQPRRYNISIEIPEQEEEESEEGDLASYGEESAEMIRAAMSGESTES